jgi:hypothetical protein
MNMRDCDLDDVFADEFGRLWRCVGLFREPTVRLEPLDTPDQGGRSALFGGVSGMMWDGFKKIYSPEKRPKDQAQ